VNNHLKTIKNFGESTMKKTARLIIVIITTFGLASCGIVSSEIATAETSAEQSAFKQNFSIGPAIEAHKELLIDGPRSLSGTEAGPREPFIQSHEYMVIQVDSDNATSFFDFIRSDIQETLSNSDAEITGSGGFDGQVNPIAYFSYSYSEGPFYGVIDVWGIRGEDNQFILISQITEGMIN